MRVLVARMVVLGSIVALIVGVAHAGAGSTVWVCKPGLPADPCASNLTALSTRANGATSVVHAAPAARSRFDCFYVYPTVSTEATTNADLRVGMTERLVASVQASRFSQVCRVYAPAYRQVTLSALSTHPNLAIPRSYGLIAYRSLLAGFEDYLRHDNDGRPIVFIGHSQGAVILIRLLAQRIDHVPAIRKKLVLAIILGGDVEVRTGSTDGGSFDNIPLCTRTGETGCVIAYSSFPGKPPRSALFGRPGQGVALQSGRTTRTGLAIACVNPAAIAGGWGDLDPFFPSTTGGARWVEYPGLYRARCQSADGATWLQVNKATASSDKRPTITSSGPDWGYHTDDVNVALGNLVADVAAAERTWVAHR